MSVAELEPGTLVENLKGGNSIVKFYASWCGHCQSYEKQYADLAARDSGTNYYRMDMDKHRGELGASMEQLSAAVSSYPTILGFRTRNGGVQAVQLSNQSRTDESMQTLAESVKAE